MARILILGGYGLTGKPLARHLLEQSDAQVLLGGRNPEKAQRYASELNAQFVGGRVSGVGVDAADAHSLAEVLREVDLLLIAAPVTQHTQAVARAALEAGVDYLDVELGAQKLATLQALAPEIERAGRCFVTEAGFHPGLPAALVRYAAAHMERIEAAITAAYLNMGQSLPYSEAVDELMDVFQNYQAQVFKHGNWTNIGSYELRKVDFGGEIGERQCYSMFFEELRALPELYPTLHEVGFYMAGMNWLLDWVISPLAVVALKVAPQAAKRPMGKLVWWGMQRLPKPPHLVLLKVEACGEKEGKPVQFEASVSHPDGYELTAVPVAAYLLQYLDASGRKPGLWMMGHLAEPLRLFRDMERMGVQVEVRVSPR